ncbi:MAG: DNA polymerase III subunit gamma/tau [Leptospiraceae bacterium]|nr:DNA polymerase III subunit gamma/tau [Leptospiraceae bacterium]
MNETHLVLARKYRPQKFKEVIYQEIPINALQNALKHNRVGHAYIFFGPRGVGKTTIARILAKRLNCEAPEDNEPCNQCTSCVEITRGVSNDVIEIDAASNRGIDDIRGLRENVKFNAMGGRYRVYIIDEVHMLSIPAFNALLKTLEEPPPHVVFVLATTDFHKVPETILSRCQDFIFKKVPVLNLQSYIETLCKTENLKFDSEGLFWIAKKGDGSVRDTLSFMEQAVTFTDGNLSGAAVGKMIGYHGIDPHETLLKSILEESNANKLLEILERYFAEGIDLSRYLWDFLDFVHSSIMIKENSADKENLNFPKEDILKIQQLVSTYRTESLLLISERIYYIYEKLSMLRLRNSYEIKIFLEIQLRKLIHEINKPSLAGVLEKINHLNEMVKKDINHLPSHSPENSMEDKKSNHPGDVEGTLKDKFSGVEVENYPEIE